MQKRTVLIFLSSIMLFAIFSSGCGPLKPVGTFYDNFTSYYNTFYNVKKKFNEAEKVRLKNIREHHDPNTEPTIPINTYQEVIESGATLLEYYPNCRWIDDTLLLMGIAYTRLTEYGRAERKFSELITIFKNSEHLSAAYVWKARVIAKQGREEEAEKGLIAALPYIKDKIYEPQANLVLADFYAEKKNWNDASSYYEKAVRNIRNRDEQNDAYFAYGNSLLNQKQYESAQDAFFWVIKHSRNTYQVFDASILWSRCAIQLGEFDSAEQLLLRLRRNPEFELLRYSIDVEIAALSVAIGQIDRGIELYQDFVSNSENSEEKGIAYYRLGEIYRDSKINLELAKANFDSVGSSGASRSLMDSAQTASEGLTRGLHSISQIETLKDSISLFEWEADSLRNVDWSLVTEETTVDSVDTTGTISDTSFVEELVLEDADSLEFQPDSLEMAEEIVLPNDSMLVESDSISTDSTLVEQVEDSLPKWKGQSPAAMMADSLLNAIKAEREVAEDTTAVADSMIVEVETVEEDTLSVLERRALNRIQYLDSSVVDLKVRLMSTYLQSAEFFDEVLNEPDSSFNYLVLAAENPCQHENYWKAALQLAGRLKEKEPADSERIQELYQKALSVESIPVSVANDLRERIGLERHIDEIPPQEKLLTTAEAAYLGGTIETDSVIALYQKVIEADSTSAYGLQAWFALQYIYEHDLEDFESAIQITQTMIELFPDSSFVTELDAKLKEPPEDTIFEMTDEEIAELRLQAHQVQSAVQDSTGWPPEEETLKGRRYR